MKFTVGWLKEHLDTDASLEDITNKLTEVGLEVEGVENLSETLGAFKVVEVIEAKQHPDADKLRVCRVKTIDGEVQVVCGAPNAKTGMKAVFAPSGSHIPGTDFTLKPTKIRGVESNGMLVSEREMCLSDEHDGIIELDASAEVGTPMATAMALDDPMIEIAITPNRPDCLGVYGVARDLAAAGLGTLKNGKTDPIKGSYASPIAIDLKFTPDTADACPVFAGRAVKGVKNGPSPDWMQKRLRAIGLRPINALVDITNYVSFDRGRPLHVYDADKVKGTIHARLSEPGEKLLALDGKEYALEDGVCVIGDESGAIGLGGVMGGDTTGSQPETTSVFIESAYFDPMRTAATGRKLGVLSDARYRFERGVDPAYVIEGLELATKLVLELCGGEASDLFVAGCEPAPNKVVEFDPALVNRLTGLSLGYETITDILTKLGFTVTGDGAPLSVAVPSWRPDIEGAADLVEEVVRIYGLDNVPSVALPRAVPVAKPILTLNQDRLRLARRALAARGLREAVTWSFVDEAEAKLFQTGTDKTVTLENPIASDLSTMRPSLLPGLLKALGRNIDRGFSEVALFEAGPQYAGDAPEDQTLAVTGLRRVPKPRSWHEGAHGADVFDAKADALAALEAAGAPIDSLQIATNAPAWYHPGRSGVLQLGPKNVFGYFGELHPRVLDALDIKGPVAAFEVFPTRIPAPKKTAKTRAKLDVSNLMALARDFAFVVKDDVAADTLVRAARGADKKLIADVSVFDLYAGKGVEEGHKSLAIEVTLQPREKTLTDEEIEAVSQKVIAAVQKATGGVLRQ